MSMTTKVVREYDGPARVHATLKAATRKPPQEPEAEIRCGAELLAQADEFEAKWVFTAAGVKRLELEARGHDADAILSVMLPEDLGVAS